MTMFCTYKPKQCTLLELTKKGNQARFFIPAILALWVTITAIGVSPSMQTNRSMNPSRMNNNQMYCIANDWRSRDRKAEEFQTLTNCRFTLPMKLGGKIPFGTMYCTYTQSYCTKLGRALDNKM